MTWNDPNCSALGCPNPGDHLPGTGPAWCADHCPNCPNRPDLEDTEQ